MRHMGVIEERLKLPLSSFLAISLVVTACVSGQDGVRVDTGTGLTEVDEGATTTAPPGSAPSAFCGEAPPLFPTLVPGVPSEDVPPDGQPGPGPDSLPAEDGQLVAHWEGDFGVVVEMRWPGTPYVESTGGGEEFEVAGHPATLAPYSPDLEAGRYVVQVLLSDSSGPCGVLSVDAYGPIPDAAADTARAFAEGLRPRSELEEYRADLQRAEQEQRARPLCVPPPVDPGPGQMTVEIYQLCEKAAGVGELSPVQPVERVVATTAAPLRVSLQALVSGALPAEEEAGFGSWFSSRTAGVLRGVGLGPGGLAVIDLEGATILALGNVSTSRGGALFRGQLLGTAFQFPTVEAVEVRLDGRPEAYCALLEMDPDCNPTIREEWLSMFEEAPSPEVPSLRDRDLVLALLRFARSPSPERAQDLPFADQVWLGLGTELLARRDRDQLGDPAAWLLDVGEYAGHEGPLSSLQVLGDAVELQISVGPHPHCASPPQPAPETVAGLRRVSIQPFDPDDCLRWWTVDLFIGERAEVEAVTLDLWEP